MSKQKITSTYSLLFLSPNFSDLLCKIKIIDASFSKKSLGHHFSLNGDMHQQKARTHKIIDESVLLTSTAKLSKHDGVYFYHTYIFSHLRHLLACMKNLIGI